MRTTVEPLEGNKVKLCVEVDEGEIEAAVAAAVRKIAKEVRIPGFRPGKAPRRLLEARLGRDHVRQEALREAMPGFYARAVAEHDLDAIAAPEIEVTAGAEEGPVTFDAVVELRPQVSVPGYQGLQVTIPSPHVSDDDVAVQVDRLRDSFAQLQPVTRPARDRDHVTIDIRGYRHDQTIDGLTAEDLLYEVGSGSVVPELDANLRGARTGDILKFNAAHSGEEVAVQLLVKDVKEKVLPEVTDEWASEASEFGSVAELQADLRHRMGNIRRMQSLNTLHERVLDALVELVTIDLPEALVVTDANARLADMVRRIQAQGSTIEQYLEATGDTTDHLVEHARAAATRSVKADLALRAVADAEGIEVSDDALEKEIERLARRSNHEPAALRRELERSEHMGELRADVRKGTALRWLVERVDIVDGDGHPVDRADLEPIPEPAPGGAETPAPEQAEPQEAHA